MRVKEKSNFLSFFKTELRFLKAVFIDVDYPEGEGKDISKSNDPEMAALKESLGRVDALERKFYVDSTSPKGGKSGSIVEKAEVDTEKAMEAAEGQDVQRDEERGR